VSGKVYRGEQPVLFGRYAKGGEAHIQLDARLTGEDASYRGAFELPEKADDYPELERLWALRRIEEIETRSDAGLLEGEEAGDAIRDLGVAYQLVTDETSMLVLDDVDFEHHGVERRNRQRVAVERAAQAQRRSRPVTDPRVDRERPMFDLPAPAVGGGAIDPLSATLAAGLGALAGRARRRSGDRRRS